MLICPVCKKQLSKSGGSYVCPEKHSFDISRRGYVNLLQSQSPKNHGDDKQMAAARREFLNGGFYSVYMLKYQGQLRCGYLLRRGLLS